MATLPLIMRAVLRDINKVGSKVLEIHPLGGNTLENCNPGGTISTGGSIVFCVENLITPGVRHRICGARRKT